MEKVLEALKKLLPEDEVKDVATAVQGLLDEAKEEMESEFEAKLEDSYAKHTEELASNEKIATEGYQQAYAIIQDLRNRLEVQKEEFDSQVEKEYEEAYRQIQDEQGKNKNIEVEMYEEYEKKLEEMRDYIVDKVDTFLKLKGGEIYEQAKKDIINDPRMTEQKVALDRILEVAQTYISDEDYSALSNAKFSQACEEVEKLKGQVKVLEAKSIRLVGQKEKLEEQVRQQAEQLITEQKRAVVEDKKERTEKAENASGRGKKHTEEIIAEFSNNAPAATDEETLNEYHELNVLAGVSSND